MRTVAFLSLLILALFPPSGLLSQEVAEVEDLPVPSRLAEIETERSRVCVPVLARMDGLEAELQPISRRVERLRALDAAVAVEDSVRVAPFDADDPVEAAVREWFERDAELAQRYLEEEDEAIVEERRTERTGIRSLLQEEFAELNQRGRDVVEGEGDLQSEFARCEGAIFVRSVVLEECESTSSPLCERARASDPDALEEGGQSDPFEFVASPEDVWGLEHLRPWRAPTGLRPTPSGLAGARSAALTRRGNLTLVLSVEPIIRDRSSVDEAEARDMEAHLESLGYDFDHPGFLFTPALGVDLDLLAPLGNENAYILHFGDLSDPEDQIIWTTPAAGGGPIQELLAVEGEVLTRLAAGEEVSFTAVHVPEGAESEAEAVFSLAVPAVNQASAISSLLTYMSDGALAADLARIFPPEGSSEGSRGGDREET